jgi:hypothetical protein
MRIHGVKGVQEAMKEDLGVCERVCGRRIEANRGTVIIIINLVRVQVSIMAVAGFDTLWFLSSLAQGLMS